MGVNKAEGEGISTKISRYLNGLPIYVFIRRYQVIKMIQSKESNLSLQNIVKDIILAGGGWL